jgi:hypothetical protein
MHKAAITFALGSVLWIPALSIAGDENQREEKTYEIRKLDAGESIKLDGILSEAAWSRADVARDFSQQAPDEGKPATQQTEVRLLYDEKNIYVGYRCWQTTKIVVTDIAISCRSIATSWKSYSMHSRTTGTASAS